MIGRGSGRRAPRFALLACVLTASPVSLAATTDAGAPSVKVSTAKAPAAVAKNAPAAPKAAPAKAAPAKASAAATAKAAASVKPSAGRRAVAGGPTSDDASLGAETEELRALAAAERELFPPAGVVASTWPSELPSPLAREPNAPRVHTSGLPPEPVPSSPPVAEGGRDLHWLEGLEMPDLPVRWEPHLVKYLEFFKSDPRGRQLFSVWLKRSGRYRVAMRRALRQKGLPEDLVWLSMIESGFDATARSPVGAAGLWQFMPQTGKLYGLDQDRWLDERFDPSQATLAAADFLADLHRRFGSWELAIASYNMGYGGMLAVVRRYNTNDYWALSRLEAALPWETTLYVPKIVAAAIVARNLKTFGYADAAVDAPLDGDEVAVPPGIALSAVAQAAGTTVHELETMNPQYRAGRTPPDPSSTGGYPVRVPDGRGAAASALLARMKGAAPATDRYVVRFGDTLEQIAAAHKCTAARLAELNGIRASEMVHGGAVLLVPHGSAANGAGAGAASAASAPGLAATVPAAASTAADEGGKLPTVVVPADVFVYPDRKRVFYRVGVGDTLKDVAGAFHVSADEVRRWNDLDPVARLHDGMTLQLFVAPETDLSSVAVLAENQVRVVPVGSEDFFASWDGMKGRRRVSIPAKAGDTLTTLAKRLGVPVASLERINRRGASEAYRAGDEVIVYLPDGLRGPDGATLPGTLDSKDLPAGPDPLGPLPEAPDPASLPAVPSSPPAIAPPLPAFLPRTFSGQS